MAKRNSPHAPRQRRAPADGRKRSRRELADEKRLARRIAKLEAKLSDRMVRAAEMHHRIKNTLQLFLAMLNLEASAHPELRDAFSRMQARVTSLGRIYDLLRQSRMVDALDFGAHLQEIADAVVASFGKNEQVTVRVEADPMLAEAKRAVPLTLIVHELLTNALKHAFPDRRQGEVRVRLRRLRGMARLTVSDNGIGLPRKSAETRQGTDLLQALGGQLQGRVLRRSRGRARRGTTVTVAFPVERV